MGLDLTPVTGLTVFKPTEEGYLVVWNPLAIWVFLTLGNRDDGNWKAGKLRVEAYWTVWLEVSRLGGTLAKKIHDVGFGCFCKATNWNEIRVDGVIIQK
jgi:hypothetical protein